MVDNGVKVTKDKKKKTRESDVEIYRFWSTLDSQLVSGISATGVLAEINNFNVIVELQEKVFSNELYEDDWDE